MSARRKHIPERQLWFLSLKKENAYPHIFLAASPLVLARFAREFFVATPLLRPARQNRHATQATERQNLGKVINWLVFQYHEINIVSLQW